MALERLKAYQSFEKFGPSSWGGVAVFRCPNKQAMAAANGLYGQGYPRFGGGDVPTCRRARIKYHKEPGKAWIIGYYKSGFGTAGRTVGKARLVGKVIAKPTGLAQMKDQEGKIVYGPDPDGIHEWVLIEGAAVDMQSVEVCVLQTAVLTKDLNLAAIRARHRCINGNVLPHFGNAPLGALLLWTVRYENVYESDITDLDYEFRVSPQRDANGNVLSWNAGAKSQQGVDLPVRMPVFDAGDPIQAPPATWSVSMEEPYRTKTQFLPGYRLGKTAAGVWSLTAVGKEGRKPHPTADFSDLDAMLAWQS